MERVSRDPHKVAALAYGGLGVLVILITFGADLVPAGRGDALWQLAVGAVFVLTFAALIYWRGWWWLSAFLIFSNLWRAISYVHHGLGMHLQLRTLRVTPIEPKPVAFVNAALMAVVVLLLARSAWIGFSAWRTQRLVEGEP